MGNIFILPLLIIFLSLFIEFILRSLWTPFYFNHGVVIYKKTVILREHKELDLQFLENEMSKSQILYPNMLFRKQPDGKIFFREATINYKFIQPFMHGLIIRENNTITVIGRLNWHVFMLFFFLPLSLIFFNPGGVYDIPIYFAIPSFALLIIFGIIIPYFANVSRYNELLSLIKSHLDLK